MKKSSVLSKLLDLTSDQFVLVCRISLVVAVFVLKVLRVSSTRV